MNRISIVLFAMTPVMVLPSTLLGQAGSLDSSFGTRGKITTSVIGTNSVANAVALQTDGKVLVAGGLGGNQDFGVIRYNPNGSLDLKFGVNGIAMANIPNGILSVAIGVGVQADGRITTGGTIYTIDSAGLVPKVFIGLGLVRFDSNGSVDSSFGQDGVITTTPFNASQCNATAFAVQADAKILLAGGCTMGTGPTTTNFSAIARYEANGSLDPSFGTGGVAVLAEAPVAIALQSDSKIVVAGGGIVSRYNTDGSIDESFGIFGSAGAVGSLSAVAVQRDGKVVAAGTFSDQPSVTREGKMIVLRYNPDGTVDETFGTRGGAIAKFSSAGASTAAGFALAIESNGDILVGGKAIRGSSPSEFALARFTAVGALDSSFGNGGTVVTGFGTSSASLSGMALQADGKIIAAGNAMDTAAGSDAFAVARYTSE